MHNIELVVVAFFFFFLSGTKLHCTKMYIQISIHFFFRAWETQFDISRLSRTMGSVKKKFFYKSYIMDDLRHYLTPISGIKAEIPAKSSVLV